MIQILLRIHLTVIDIDDIINKISDENSYLNKIVTIDKYTSVKQQSMILSVVVLFSSSSYYICILHSPAYLTTVL